ncbi:MAG: gamma-glutamyltransferase family protein, partial [Spirochaetaceae bacterium]|nr:gamma-glutamyltransferase family protein [Spirochaetaceae bacterium]
MRTRVAIAAPNRASADAAVRVAGLGGGAVDAAVAAMLVAMVNEPGIVSLAGGAYVTVWPAGDRDAVTVDGYVAMPGLGRPEGAPDPVAREIRTDYGGGLIMTAGHASVATPGALAGLDLAQSRWGSLPWREVVAPAEEVARRGFPLGSAAGYYLPYVMDSLLAWDRETAASVHRDDGAPVATGNLVVIDGLADSLELIATEGARTLYDGELARRVVSDMADRGGLVTSRDLGDYRPVVRPALGVRAGPWSLRTNPPPAIGGAVLAAMLTLLGQRPQDVARLVAVQQRVLDVRLDRLDVAHDREAAALDLLREVGWQSAGPASTAHVSVV